MSLYKNLKNILNKAYSFVGIKPQSLFHRASLYEAISLIYGKSIGLSSDQTTLNWSLKYGLVPEQIKLARSLNYMISLSVFYFSSSSLNSCINLSRLLKYHDIYMKYIPKELINAIDDIKNLPKFTELLIETLCEYKKENNKHLAEYQNISPNLLSHSIESNNCSTLASFDPNNKYNNNYIKLWEEYCYACHGTFLANTIASISMIGGHNSKIQNISFKFARYFSYTIDIYESLLNYEEYSNESLQWSLPLILWISEKEVYERRWIVENSKCSLLINKINPEILNSNAIEISARMMLKYIGKCEEILFILNKSCSKDVLFQILENFKLLINEKWINK